jgi:glycine cleavage system H protein
LARLAFLTMNVYRGCAFPDELKYDVGLDVWVRFENDGTVTCGMTDPAQTRGGKLIHVQFRTVGKQFARGRAVATIESGKWVGPFPTPLSGELIATNQAAFARDILVANRDPYDAGWFVKIRPTNLAAERNFLVDSETAFAEYQKKIEELKINCMRCMD